MNISIQANLFDFNTYTTKNGVFGATLKLIDFKSKSIVDLNTNDKSIIEKINKLNLAGNDVKINALLEQNRFGFRISLKDIEKM